MRAVTGWGLKEAKDFVEGQTKYCTPQQASELRAVFTEGLYEDTNVSKDRL